MEPRIQYAKTSDGVSIAYWTLGKGEPPLVHMTAGSTSSQRNWQTSSGRQFMEAVAEEHVVVRFDGRGIGFSQRNVADYSLDAQIRDLEAVADGLGFRRFALLGSVFSVPIALSYAARHPDRVSHVVLIGGFARVADMISVETIRAMLTIAETDWKAYTEILARQGMGWAAEGDAQARQYAAAIRESVEPADHVAIMRSVLAADVSAILPSVTAPVLVLHRRGWPAEWGDATRKLMADLPNAQLLMLEGADREPFSGDVDAILRAIKDFLGPDTSRSQRPNASASKSASSVVTILFTDLASSTAITQRLGDAKAQELVRAHNTIVREALAAHGGTEIKHTGDGIMASFGTASGALECAVAIQRAVEAQNQEPRTQNREAFQVHVGLNAGEPVAEESDLFGTAVQLARRICDHAEAGQVLVSNVVRELAAGKGFLFSDVGEVVPRGFEEPVRLYEVSWRE